MPNYVVDWPKAGDEMAKPVVKGGDVDWQVVGVGMAYSQFRVTSEESRNAGVKGTMVKT